MIKRLLIVSFLLGFGVNAKAQVNWLSFEQLDSAFKANPKPVMLDFYTDWCTYCKKMDKEVFTNEEIINKLNEGFYAVRFDAESDQPVYFDGARIEKQSGARFHDMALLLAARRNEFAPPAVIFLNADFKVEERYLEYISRKQLIKRLEKYSLQ